MSGESEVVRNDRATLTLVCQCGELCKPPWGTTAAYGAEVGIYAHHVRAVADALLDDDGDCHIQARA